jgi:hypothetical protein
MSDTATPLTSEAALAAILAEIRKINGSLILFGSCMSRAAHAIERWDVAGVPVTWQTIRGVGESGPDFRGAAVASAPPNFHGESLRQLGDIDASISAQQVVKDLRSIAQTLDLDGLSSRDGLPVAGLRA